MTDISESKHSDEKEKYCSNKCGLPELHDKVLQTVYGAGLKLVKLRKTASESSPSL